MKEGEAGRGRAWSKRGGGVGGRELRRREGRREVGRLRQDRQGKQEGEEGGRDGRETPMIRARHGYAQKHASGC